MFCIDPLSIRLAWIFLEFQEVTEILYTGTREHRFIFLSGSFQKDSEELF